MECWVIQWSAETLLGLLCSEQGNKLLEKWTYLVIGQTGIYSFGLF